MGGAWCLAVWIFLGMGWDAGGSHITEWFLYCLRFRPMVLTGRTVSANYSPLGLDSSLTDLPIRTFLLSISALNDYSNWRARWPPLFASTTHNT